MFIDTVKDPAFWEGIRNSEEHRPLIEELNNKKSYFFGTFIFN